MAVNTYPLTIIATDAQGSPAAFAKISFRLTRTDRDILGGFVFMPENIEVVANDSGVAVIELWSNLDGARGSQYHYIIKSQDDVFIKSGNVTMTQAAAQLHNIVLEPAPEPKSYDEAAIEAIQLAAAEASTSAANALVSENAAATSLASVQTQVTSAANSATSSSTSAIASAASALAALGSENTSATNAASTSADLITIGASVTATGLDSDQTALDRIQTGLDRASATLSAANAATSEANSTASAGTALSNATSSTGSASAAALSASSASTSEINSGLSASAASTSEDNASTSATSASGSATSANNSKIQTGLDVISTNADKLSTAADVVLTNADVVLTNADKTSSAASASAAATSEGNASTSEANASSSASAASTSESNASSSETAAALSESNSSSSASAANTSAIAAGVSETNAGNSETNSAGSASSASTDAAQVALDLIDTTADAVQTALDRIQTGLDVVASGNSASAASTSEGNASTSEGNASGSETNASASELKALQWAITVEDTVVPGETGKYSSLHHAAKASDSAANALTSEGNASNSETAAGTSETNAASSESAAASSQSAAALSEGNASTSEDNAALSETASGISETNSSNSAIASALSETNAGDSETAAALSAVAANGSASSAATSEGNAATSETNSSNSESAASASAGAASTSETNAGNSETAASASAANALTSEGNTSADAVQTALDVISTAADAASTAADRLAVESFSLTQNKLDATVAPGVNDDASAGYSVGSYWIDEVAIEAYRCVDDTVGAAVWAHSTLSSDELAAVALSGNSDSLVQGSTQLLMTAAERVKLGTVATNAEENVQADWNSGSGDSLILNKPTTISAGQASDIAASKSKLAGIETGATADLSAAEIKVLYESNASTNAFHNSYANKLNDIELEATADQTDAEIKTAYETNLDTNAFTDAEQTKLGTIASGAEVNVTPDWNAESGASFIANKPATMTAGQAADILANKTKLAGIESGATADQTTTEIKIAYETNADTNNFDDAAETKLSGVATGANLYIHPTGGGNTHVPDGGTPGQVLENVSDGVGVWSDPVISYVHPVNHPASIITQDASNRFTTDTEKSNWNASFGWGDHSLAGYLTSAPADTWRDITSTPVNGSATVSISSDWAFDNVKTAVPSGALFTDTVYTLPFADNSSNWNTAFGWGNHASAGYLTSYNDTHRAITSIPVNGDSTTSISSDWAFDNVKKAVPSNAVFTDTVYTLPFTNNSPNWDTAYAWGDHSVAGYLTSYNDTHRDITSTPLNGQTEVSISSDWAFDNVKTVVPSGALFTDTVYTLPFTDNSTNWDTAYGWGDHSAEGYLTSVPEVLTQGTPQTFTATASQTNFTLTSTPVKAWVWLNGALQFDGSYSIVGNDIVLAATTVGDEVSISYFIAGSAIPAEASSGLGVVAYANVASNGTLNRSDNISIVKGSTGNYAYSFITPRADAFYMINHSLTDAGLTDINIFISNKTVNGFSMFIGEGDNGTTTDVANDEAHDIIIYDEL